ncbi:carboxylesterase family protein [Pseudoroseicyclus tamaricis]|uniref:Carboxylic ester hydrolase n=1 Tax=Pseudoroseicyclus tamaricis TaxID=2705421 RepID=A0A6B2JTW6_9RHOB|nr:carboxylesterase family protein [Pseudoroseicyclus tamaricis]NDV00039.1 carboxylesterase/lipase family protein [Pseudoroseicyclus tamaricis]
MPPAGPVSTVTAPAGRITGFEERGARVFLGIPYGQAPVGELRFRPPEPVGPGEIDATRPGAAPLQVIRPRPDWAGQGREEPMGEDCLNLDLYAPPEGRDPAPVIVHAYGGGFQGGSAGSGAIDGAAFAARTGCLLIRPNMRTGALGFLHLAEHFPELSATNRGMLDLALALDWARENVAAFGGDPGRITLVGMSSGSFTATALFGAPEPPPVHAGWLMSGPASRIVLPETGAAIAEGFLERAGVRPGDLAALQALPVETILQAQESGLASDLGERNAPGGRTLGIVLDGVTLTRHPMEALTAGAGQGAGLVFGSTAEEARMWYAFGIMGETDAAKLRQTIARFAPDRVEAELAALEAAQPGASPAAHEEAFLTERIYAGPARASAEAQRQGGGAGASYTFGWAPSGELAKLGASHGFDEPFVFGSAAPYMAGSPDALSLAAEMEGALVALAETGQPGWQGHRRFG